MPLAYYEHVPPPALHDWATLPAGYIWFGKPYDKGAEQAAKRDWPTAHLPGNHLQMLTDPAAVAAAILGVSGDWL